MSAAAEITDFYETILGRKPDQAGLTYWVERVNAGMPLSVVQSALRESDEGRRRTISQYYREYLGRPVDAGGLTHWMNALRNGTPLKDVEAAIRNGVEARRRARRQADKAVEAGHESAKAVLEAVLDTYGLADELSDWAWQQLQTGASADEISLKIRDTPAFKERFKAIEIRRQHGLTPISPQDIIEYEEQARDLMRASGLPAGFYDQPDDFAQLIGKGVSLQSVARRVEQSWDRVVNSPIEVRNAFADLYGVNGDQALAAFMFDPDRSEVTLEQMARSAVAGGAMRAAGFDLDAVAAARVAGFDLQDQSVRGGFSRLAQLRAVFQESIGERSDLDAMREGVDAVFEVGEGAAAIEDRITARRNAAAGGGGAFLSQAGLAGAADS